MFIPESELIINKDGSIYHLNLRPGEVAENIITVGDPNRVPMVSKHFDSIEVKKSKREFITETGYIGKTRLTVISTGIGTDNIDIVFNEIDALHNIDFERRSIKNKVTKLHFTRIGTCGGLQEDIPVDATVISKYGVGLDSLMTYYDYSYPSLEDLKVQVGSILNNRSNYVSECKSRFLSKCDQYINGITLSSNGFYGPQGRKLRILTKYPRLIEDLSDLKVGITRVTNLEMETAAMYALSHLLGHESLSFSVVLANRKTGEFSKNPKKSMEELIINTLEIITS
jgi:uridine phosphorylase